VWPSDSPAAHAAGKPHHGVRQSRPTTSVDGFDRPSVTDSRSSPSPRSNQSGPIWRNREFSLLWAAQAISQTAQNALWYAILVLVQHKSNSNTHLSLAILTLIVPSVLFGIIAGVYVDRWDKRLVLIGSNVIRGVMVVAYLFIGDLLALVYIVNFAFSSVGQFFAPAEAAMIPAVVSQRRLLEANSLFHLTFTASQLIGLVVIGPLVVNLIGVDALFLVCGILLIVCGALCWPLPSQPGEPSVAGSQRLKEFRNDVSEVTQFIRGNAVVQWAIGVWTLGAILGIVVAMLAPGFAVNVLGVRAEDSVFVLAPAGVGMVVCTAVLSRWGHDWNKYRLVNAGLIVVSLSILALGVIGPLWRQAFGPLEPGTFNLQDIGGMVAITMAVALIAGTGFVCMIVPAQTIIQERAPVSIRGRVFSIQFMLSNVLSVIPLIFLGGLADVFGVAETLTGLAVTLLLITVISIRVSRANSDSTDSSPLGEPPARGPGIESAIPSSGD
jgi:MFS family permease